MHRSLHTLPGLWAGMRHLQRLAPAQLVDAGRLGARARRVHHVQQQVLEAEARRARRVRLPQRLQVPRRAQVRLRCQAYSAVAGLNLETASARVHTCWPMCWARPQVPKSRGPLERLDSEQG